METELDKKIILMANNNMGIAKYRFWLHLGWAVAFTLIAWTSFCGFRLWVDLERYRIASIEPSARTADTLHVNIPKGFRPKVGITVPGRVK